MKRSNMILLLGALFILGLSSSAPAVAQTASGESIFSTKVSSFTPPILLGTVRTESDKLFLEIETPERKVIVGKARMVSALLTTRTLKYNGGALSVPEGANLLVVFRPEANRVVWQFYKATNPREWLSLGRPGVVFYDKNGKRTEVSPQNVMVQHFSYSVNFTKGRSE